ncbi:MAG: hypothetical protein QRY74_04850 [Chlamydia sp.]
MIYKNNPFYILNAKIWDTIEEKAIKRPILSRTLVLLLVPYSIFERAIAPFISIYSTVQRLKLVSQTAKRIPEKSYLQLHPIAEMRIAAISIAKNSGYILILPIYIIASSIHRCFQFLWSPVSVAKRNHPATEEVLNNVSITEDAVHRYIKMTGNDKDQDKKIAEMKLFYSSIKKAIPSLSIGEIKKINPTYSKNNALISKLKNLINVPWLQEHEDYFSHP